MNKKSHYFGILQNVLFTAALFIGFYSIPLSSQAGIKTAVEIDPSTFLFEGYAGHVRFTPTDPSSWAFGLGAYRMRFPHVLVDINPENSSEDWSVNLASGIGLFGEYFFDEQQSGWYIGTQVAVQTYEVKHKDSGDESATFSNFLIMPSIGYRWMLSDTGQGFFIKPWFGLGYTQKVDGKTTLGTNEYDISPLVPFMTVHIGYQF